MQRSNNANYLDYGQPFPPWIISPGVLMTLVDGSMENNAMAGIQCGLHINTWTELELVFRVLLINW